MTLSPPPPKPVFKLPTLKQLSRRAWVRARLCWLGAQYMRLIHATTHWDVEGAEIPAAFWDRKEPFIAAFWHGRLLLLPFVWRRGVTLRMLISQHSDGEYISRTLQYFDIDTVRGSSKKGGAAALRVLLRQLAEGVCVGFTPDGPGGPRMRAGEGIASLGRLAGAAILPVTVSTTRRKVLRSWDRFLVPLPFGRGLYIWGDPIRVPTDAKGAVLEEARLEIEAALNMLAADADRRTGHVPIEPAPAVKSQPAS